jgi:zinc protease
MEFSDAGMFYAIAGARPGVPLGEVESLFMAEIEKVARDGVSQEEVDRAKRQMEVSLVSGLATNHALASRIGREIVAFGRVRPLQERIDAIRRVTADDIQRVVRVYLQPESRSVVHVIPETAITETVVVETVIVETAIAEPPDPSSGAEDAQ